MGLDYNGARFLLYAQRLGVNFEHTAMIGRQSLDLTKTELRESLRNFGHSVDNQAIDKIFVSRNGYAEPLLTQLGAHTIHSFDYSRYEGATHVHDMNIAIPPEYAGRYSVVLDGGSLEHVFNFPVAIKNCMEMLRIGGHYLSITPANNFMGHGFYQFSAEIYFSVFTEQNGFEMLSLIAFEDRPKATWYAVKSPRESNSRILLVNDAPVYLLVVAKKLTNKNIFDSWPQQSDYVTTWNSEEPSSTKGQAHRLPWINQVSFRNWVKRNAPPVLRQLIQIAIQGYGFNPRFFVPMDPAQLTRMAKE